MILIAEFRPWVVPFEVTGDILRVPPFSFSCLSNLKVGRKWFW